jgi:SPP1 gp7 family putative phage head morphogenesis protein
VKCIPTITSTWLKKLTEAVAKGLGGTAFKATDYRNTLKAHLEHNVFAFSAAKSLAALEQYRSKLTTSKGEVATYAQFRTEVTQVDVEFNDNHLKTEYGNAIATAQMADKWEKLQQHAYLEYRTVGDNRVRQAHKDLNGKVFKTTDDIWDKIWPPNDWNCRCTVIPAKQGAESDDPAQVNAKEIKPYFQRNAGKAKVIYDEQHPYFKTFEKIGQPTANAVELRAKEHYNLSSVKDMYLKNDFPKFQYKTAEEVDKWFNQKAKKGTLNVVTKDGVSVDLGSNFSSKLITKTTTDRMDRTSYAHLAPNVMEHPDEIWSHFHRGNLQTTYIKYFAEKPIVIVVKNKAGKMEFETMHKISNPENKRKGVLKYRK